jgi:hypothetical protein
MPLTNIQNLQVSDVVAEMPKVNSRSTEFLMMPDTDNQITKLTVTRNVYQCSQKLKAQVTK